MAGIFRRRRRGPSEGKTSETPPGAAPIQFEPPTRHTAGAPSGPVRDRAERGDAEEVERLRQELSRERAEKARALAEADRRLVRALAEQRFELEAEARERVAQVARLREELSRERAEIEAELATTRRRLEDPEFYLAAVAQTSAHAPRG